MTKAKSLGPYLNIFHILHSWFISIFTVIITELTYFLTISFGSFLFRFLGIDECKTLTCEKSNYPNLKWFNLSEAYIRCGNPEVIYMDLQLSSYSLSLCPFLSFVLCGCLLINFCSLRTLTILEY